jgi:hypothetical protein
MRRSPGRRTRSERTARRARALSALTVLAAACAREPAPPRAPASASPPAGELRFELVFGAGADLDLYVSDPGQETVYYANPVSRASGGSLEADRRCDAEAPRVERIRFPDAPGGRYRVGVDYAQRCPGGAAEEAFLLRIEAQGERREVPGSVRCGRFLPRVVEHDERAR